MPLEIIRNDITKVHVDAIVNPANKSLLGGGGVDGAIHETAGPQLLNECRKLGGCETGQVKITKGYNLPAKYVIHTVGPVWKDGKSNEENLLANCYKNSLEMAKDYKLETIAFPLISSGGFGFPKDKALRVAISIISEFLMSNEMTVYLVVYDKKAFKLSENLSSSIRQYIDDNYIEDQVRMSRNIYEEAIHLEEALESPTFKKKAERKLVDIIKNRDESFSQILVRLIDEKGMTDTQTYKKANIDRRLFSKIRNDINYKPSKPTAIAFAIALELSLDETKDLLLSAGLALSNSSEFDLIVKYFIKENNYNIFEINEALFEFDQKPLGV